METLRTIAGHQDSVWFSFIYPLVYKRLHRENVPCYMGKPTKHPFSMAFCSVTRPGDLWNSQELSHHSVTLLRSTPLLWPPHQPPQSWHTLGALSWKSWGSPVNKTISALFYGGFHRCLNGKFIYQWWIFLCHMWLRLDDRRATSGWPFLSSFSSTPVWSKARVLRRCTLHEIGSWYIWFCLPILRRESSNPWFGVDVNSRDGFNGLV